MRGFCSWVGLLSLLFSIATLAGCTESNKETSVLAPVLAADNACTPERPEAPEPTQLLYLGHTEAEYGERLVLLARLTDGTGHPLSGRELRFVLGPLEVTALTGEYGLARVTLTPVGPPASLPLTVSYAGDATMAPASVSTRVVITRAGTVTRVLEPSLVPVGAPREFRATLVRAHDQTPLVGRTLVFEAGGERVLVTTDTAGVATASFTWDSDTTGPAVLRVAFEGDDFYEPSADELPILRYLPTAFTVWGGNTPGLRLGQRVNFWGHSWHKQLEGKEHGSHAEFKGHASRLKAFALCQPTVLAGGWPRLTPGCWSSKGGQSSPPASPPDYIGVLVTTSLAQERARTYGNVAALVVLKVDKKPAYGHVPGKPGWGTLVAVIEGGPLFPPPPSLSASQRQPSSVHPGQDFEVTVDLTNSSRIAAEQVVVSEQFEGSLPASGQQQVGTLAPGEQRLLAFSQTAPLVPPRGAQEPVDTYQSRLAAADGRLLSAVGRVRFGDPQGTAPPAVDLFSASRLQLPRLTLALSAPPCAGPCTTVSYVFSVAQLGLGRATSATATVTLPDGSQQQLELGAMEPSTAVTRTVDVPVSDPGPRRPDESVEQYLARLRAWAEQDLTVSVEVVWKDQGGNTYGPIDRRFTPAPQVALLTPTAEAPSSVLPGQGFPLQFTVTNSGTARANDARIQLEENGAATPSFALEAGQSTSLWLEVTAPPLAPRGEAEQEAAYRTRLEARNGQALTYGYSLDWGTACGGRLGPIPGQVRTFLVLPVVTVSLQGPADAPEGGTVTYVATLQNHGHATATDPVLSVVLPGGSSKDVPLPAGALARDARLEVSFTHTLPANWGSASPAEAVASIRWRDAQGNAYGPLSASTRTRVNRTPRVQAGPDQTLTLPSAARLVGSIVDDGLPEGVTPMASWVQVSGPAPVSFVNPAKASTTALFNTAGTYVLRLGGSDSQLTSSDELTVTVLPPPAGGSTGFTLEVFTRAMSMEELAPIIKRENAQWYEEHGYELPPFFSGGASLTACPAPDGDYDGDGLVGDADVFPTTLGPTVADFPTIKTHLRGELTADVVLNVTSDTKETRTLATLRSDSYTRTRSATDSLELKGEYRLKSSDSSGGELDMDIAQLVKGDFASGLTGKLTKKFSMSNEFDFSTSFSRTLKDAKVREIVSSVSDTITTVTTSNISFDESSGRIRTTFVVRNASSIPRNLEVMNLQLLIMAHDPVSGREMTFARSIQASTTEIVLGWAPGFETREISLEISGLNTHDMLTALGRGWSFEVIAAKGYLLRDADTQEVLNGLMNNISQRTALISVYRGDENDPLKRRASTVTPSGRCATLRQFLVNAFGESNIEFKMNSQGKWVIDRLFGKKARHDERDFDSLTAAEKSEYGKWVVAMYGHPDRHPDMPEEFGLDDIEVYAPADQVYLYFLTQEDLEPTSGPLTVDYFDDSVGIIPQTAGVCPNDSTRVWIFMDNEDDNAESAVNGWIGATELDGNRNTRFEFCKVDGEKFHRLTETLSYKYDYAVLKLDRNCPVGAVPFRRHFDNQDNGRRENTNENSGNIWPNEQGVNTTLNFCLFRRDLSRPDRNYGISHMMSFPDLGVPYGVFVDKEFDQRFLKDVPGWIYTDDEDRDNENSYWTPDDASIKPDAIRIVEEGRNTRLHVGKVGE